MKKKVIFILGPTGSGKTALAVSLAKKFNGEIISADSRQIYIGLDIGTGKDIDEYDSVKYHLIDICTPEENFSLFDWLEQAKITLENILKKGKLPIVVGGTGLYSKALAEGFELSRPKPGYRKTDNKTARIRREKLDLMAVEQLQKMITELKINTENLDLRNPRRLIRAIEKNREGAEAKKSKPNFESLSLAINLPREEVYNRIDRRVDLRFKRQGMLEEVENLIKQGVSKEWLKSLGLEYKFITKHLEGEYSFEEMAQELKWKTHAYARRQITWLKKQKNLIWIENKQEANQFVEKFIKKN